MLRRFSGNDRWCRRNRCGCCKRPGCDSRRWHGRQRCQRWHKGRCCRRRLGLNRRYDGRLSRSAGLCWAGRLSSWCGQSRRWCELGRRRLQCLGGFCRARWDDSCCRQRSRRQCCRSAGARGRNTLARWCGCDVLAMTGNHRRDAQDIARHDRNGDERHCDKNRFVRTRQVAKPVQQSMHVLHDPKAGRNTRQHATPHTGRPQIDGDRASCLTCCRGQTRLQNHRKEMVPAAGVEPARASSARRILSPLRMPISPRRLVKSDSWDVHGVARTCLFTGHSIA